MVDVLIVCLKMTHHPPTIETDRLVLRPFVISDSNRVMGLAGDRRIYATTLAIPHPYGEGVAEKWISSHPSIFYNNKGVDLAVTLKESGEVIGAVGLVATASHQRAELGYWIGVPYWGHGYCTEAAKVLIDYGFRVLGYHRITACHVISNPASGRVMAKAGMELEGTLVDHVYKDERFHTLVTYGILNSEQGCDGQRATHPESE